MDVGALFVLNKYFKIWIRKKHIWEWILKKQKSICVI